MDMIKARFETVNDALVWAEAAFTESELFFGHGTDNAWDEAVVLLSFALKLPMDVERDVLERPLTASESLAIERLFQQRIERRLPAPYLTKQAWFCGLPFYVDERVIIPRSPIAELINSQFMPWVESSKVHRILDLCCGSACIGIACHYAFPEAIVIASDISDDALAVAAQNVEQHACQKSVQLIKSDLFDSIPPQKFDIIVSNPPYVDTKDLSDMPAEFGHEPKLALEAGHDGLDCVRKILKYADEYLSEKGILVVEVGNSASALEAAFPEFPFIWLEFEYGGDGVFLIGKRDDSEKIAF